MITSARGTVSKRLEARLEGLEILEMVMTVQTTTVLRSMIAVKRGEVLEI